MESQKSKGPIKRMTYMVQNFFRKLKKLLGSLMKNFTFYQRLKNFLKPDNANGKMNVMMRKNIILLGERNHDLAKQIVECETSKYTFEFDTLGKEKIYKNKQVKKYLTLYLTKTNL